MVHSGLHTYVQSRVLVFTEGWFIPTQEIKNNNGGVQTETPINRKKKKTNAPNAPFP